MLLAWPTVKRGTTSSGIKLHTHVKGGKPKIQPQNQIPSLKNRGPGSSSDTLVPLRSSVKVLMLFKIVCGINSLVVCSNCPSKD